MSPDTVSPSRSPGALRWGGVATQLAPRGAGSAVVVEVDGAVVEVDVVEVDVVDVDVDGDVDVVDVDVGAVVSAVRIVVVGCAIVAGGGDVVVGVDVDVVVVVRGAVPDASAGAGSVVVVETVVGVRTRDCGVIPGSASGPVVVEGTVEGAPGGTSGSGGVVARSAGSANGAVLLGTVPSTAGMAEAVCSERAA